MTVLVALDPSRVYGRITSKQVAHASVSALQQSRRALRCWDIPSLQATAYRDH